MTLRLLAFLSACALVVAGRAALVDSPDQDQRIRASFMLAFGRAPTPAEMGDAGGAAAVSTAELRETYLQRIESDAGLRRDVATRACEDAFGREPTDAELAEWTREPRTYAAWMQLHLQAFAKHPDEYQRVLDRAYRFLIRRGVYPAEVGYWKEQGTVPYVLVVGCVENWARRNAPGLMETEGTPTIASYSRFLTTLRLSAATAADVRSAFGLMTPEELEKAEGFGHNVVAPGAEPLFTEGGIRFAAVGGADALPTR